MSEQPTYTIKEAAQVRADELSKKRKEKVVAIVVDDKAAFFRKPRRAEISYAMTLLDKDPLGAYGSILSATFLEGDRGILDDDDYFMSAAPLANQLITQRAAEILK